MKDHSKEKYLFESSPVFEAIVRLALPTVIGQIILVIYNMADTFFIGMTGSAEKLTAVTICMPAFMFLSAISNLFGIGAVGVISRAIGARQPEKEKEASSFAFWGCFAAAGVYSLLCLAFLTPYVNVLGGSAASVYPLAKEYLVITVVCGGVLTAENTLMGHLIRAEGRSLAASVGIGMGGVLNIILDPLFMFVIFPRGHEVRAAALATLISNAAAFVYFFLYYFHLKRAKTTGLSLKPRRLTKPVVTAVLATGTPACLMTLCENLSYVVLDNLMSYNGIPAQAGIGVAKKVNMLAHCMVRGMSQGVLPLIGYTWAAGMRDRMRKAVRLSAGASVGLAVVCMAVSLIFAVPLVRLFNQGGGLSVQLGAHFLRILCIGGPFSAWAYSCISIFQGVNENRRSLVLALMRKGVLDIPMMFLLRLPFPLSGIVAATPVTDGIVCLAAAILYTRFVHRKVTVEQVFEDV